MSAIRRQVSIEKSPRAVWTAISTAEGLKSWLCDDATVNGAAAGRFSIVNEGDDGEPLEDSGRIHTFRPTSKLEVAFDKNSKGPWKGTHLQFTVAREGDETVMNVVHSGPAFDDEAVRAEADDTWRRALTSLRDSLEAG